MKKKLIYLLFIVFLICCITLKSLAQTKEVVPPINVKRNNSFDSLVLGLKPNNKVQLNESVKAFLLPDVARGIYSNLQLKNKQLNIVNKEKEIQHLAYLKSQADFQLEQIKRKEKENALTIAEKEKALQNTKLSLQESQLNLKDNELKSKQKEKLFYIAGITLLVLLSFFIFYNFRNQQIANKEILTKNEIITNEKDKSDKLLLNILPAEIAEELKKKGEIDAQHFDNVSVLFTDFVNFTGISETLTPKALVAEIHQCFTAFDAIMEKNGLEKIKTIGDAYLAVCGLPKADPLHAQKTVQAALEISRFIVERKLNDGVFAIRIGIHSGPLVAGIVGVKKFAYDIWGDTVNTAARMEQNSEPGKINISGATFELVKNEYNCIHRGKIAAKNKGDIDMYFVEDKNNRYEI